MCPTVEFMNLDKDNGEKELKLSDIQLGISGGRFSVEVPLSPWEK